MEKRYYNVGGIIFSVEMQGPWKFMEITPAVRDRVNKAAAGEEIHILPTRAGDDVPARTFVQTKNDLPINRTKYDLDFSQYEPFRCDSAAEAFSIKVFEKEPEWVSKALEDGTMKLIMSVDEELPAYYIYKYEDKTIFRFDADRGHIAGTLCMSADYSQGEFYPQEGYGPYTILFQLNTSIMIAYTYNGALRNALLMHSSVVRHNGKANFFLGKSGTGKSTHSRLWLSNVEGCDLVNDDNPVLRVMDGPAGEKLYVFGSPWSGKTPCYRNISVEVRAIVRLDQAPKNEARKLSGLDAYASIIASASSIRWDRKIMDGLTSTAEKVVGLADCWHLDCLPDADAAFTCLKAIEG